MGFGCPLCYLLIKDTGGSTSSKQRAQGLSQEDKAVRGKGGRER